MITVMFTYWSRIAAVEIEGERKIHCRERKIYICNTAMNFLELKFYEQFIHQ